MQNSFTSQYKNFALLNSTKKPVSFSPVITSAKSIKFNTRNKGYLSDNKISLSTDLLNDYTYTSPEKNKFRSKYHQRSLKSENYAEQALTTPNNLLKKKMSGFRNQINLKKKGKKHISIDLTNGVNSPMSLYRCYPYTANHNKCVSLTEKDMIKGLKSNAYYESKEEELQSLNNNNNSAFKKNASIQFQQSVPLYFWDKRSNSNSTNVTSLKDQLSDYNDVSSMLGGRLNFKKNLRGQGGYFKLVSDISSHFSKFNKKLQTIIQKETKQEDNNAQNEESNNTLDEIKHIQSETENECEKELINNIHMDINNHILDSEDNSISSKDEIDNNPFLESQINQTLSKFKIKNKNKLFMKQLSRISEISVKQSNNDSASNIEVEKTEHIQTKTLKNKLKNINEILTNNTPVETEGNKETPKRPLSNKDSSKRTMLMINENNIKKTKDDSIIQTSSNVKIGINDNKGISNKKTYSLYYEMSSAMESSSSFSGDNFFMKKCKTNVNTDFSIYSNFSKNKKFKDSNTNLFDNNKEDNCISQKTQKLLNFFLCDIEDNTYEEKNEKLKDHFLAKSINSVTKYLADIVDFDPEDSMMNHDEVGTKSYLRPIKHSKSKHNEDMFLYIYNYSYNFYRKMNRYPIPRTVTATSSNIKDKSDCIFVRYNSITKSLADYIRENCLVAHKEMLDYLFYGRYSDFKNKSMIENFIKEERHRRERIKTIRKNITKKLKEKATIIFDNNVILYNSHLMTRDIKYDNSSINLRYIRAYQRRGSTLLGKTKKQRNSNFLTQKKRSPKMIISKKNYSPDTQFKNSKTSPSDLNIVNQHTNKFDEKVLEKEITSKFALRSQSLSPIALISNNTKNNLVLNSDAHYVNNRNTQSTSTFNSRLNYPLLQKESVLLRTYEIKNNIINNLNTLAESIIFHIKDGNYHNFLELMTKYKIDPNTRDKDGNTFLILAVNSNSPDIVDYLIKKDFDVNAFNNNHNTALHYAISHRNYNLVDYLIKNGADENIKNLDGKTPWECLANGITLNSYE